MKPSNTATSLAKRLVETVVYKERLRRENNKFAAEVKAGRMLMAEFRAYQDNEFDPRIDACLDDRTKIEAAIMLKTLGRE